MVMMSCEQNFPELWPSLVDVKSMNVRAYLSYITPLSFWILIQINEF